MSEKRVLTDTAYGPSIMSVYVCDGCGTETSEAAMLNWVSFDTAGVTTQRMQDWPTPLHACSFTCARDTLRKLSWLADTPEEG